MITVNQAQTAFWAFLAIFLCGSGWYVFTFIYALKNEEIDIYKTFRSGLVGWLISSLGMVGTFFSGIIWIVLYFNH